MGDRTPSALEYLDSHAKLGGGVLSAGLAFPSVMAVLVYYLITHH